MAVLEAVPFVDDQVLPADAQQQVGLLHHRLVVADEHLELIRLLPAGLLLVGEPLVPG